MIKQIPNLINKSKIFNYLEINILHKTVTQKEFRIQI